MENTTKEERADYAADMAEQLAEFCQEDMPLTASIFRLAALSILQPVSHQGMKQQM